MTRIIAIAVPKGGTGKTTTTLNLGAALAEQGQRVLLVDFDPQGNLTQALGVLPQDLTYTVYDAIRHYTTRFESNLAQAIRRVGPLDLVPASARLNLANDELATTIKREYVLQKLLRPIAAGYDFILIDTLPYLGVLVLNALAAADEVIAPVQTEYLATESVQLLFDQVNVMRQSDLNPGLRLRGILLTMVDERTLLHRNAAEYIRETIGQQAHVFETQIKRTIRVGESQAHRQTILEYEPQGEVAQAYRALAREVLHDGS